MVWANKKKHRRMGFMLVLGREQEMKVLRCTECTRGVLIHKSTRCILSGEKLHREGIPSPSKAVLGAWVETARQRDLGYSYAQIAPGQPGTTEQLSCPGSVLFFDCLLSPSHLYNFKNTINTFIFPPQRTGTTLHCSYR